MWPLLMGGRIWEGMFTETRDSSVASNLVSVWVGQGRAEYTTTVPTYSDTLCYIGTSNVRFRFSFPSDTVVPV